MKKKIILQLKKLEKEKTVLEEQLKKFAKKMESFSGLGYRFPHETEG